MGFNIHLTPTRRSCPWCANRKLERLITPSGNDTAIRIVCSECGARGPTATSSTAPDQADVLWNQRNGACSPDACPWCNQRKLKLVITIEGDTTITAVMCSNCGGAGPTVSGSVPMAHAEFMYKRRYGNSLSEN